ncbi:tyrosine-type recombinase/integrase [Desulforhopalus singaporensis]|uniref:Site-specific recombinase XerD n=1 Tax=Desulforhopalus singaporensis TaxID=91360 RepID=A0A1H0RHG4_9BACT|nr:site-specific integrase [Desulforhopalus singaporensis]SDP29013.1 Site-specific recombinase XerD [Desulforhopalus singaporensis]
MLVNEAVNNYMQYHEANSRPNTVRGFGFTLLRFADDFRGCDIRAVSENDVLSFLTKISSGKKQATKSSRASMLRAFYNFTADTAVPGLSNPCCRPMIRKIFRRPRMAPPRLVDKDLVDEIIYRTTDERSRLMMELMGRAGMRVGEVLGVRPDDIDDGKITIRRPKSGRLGEAVFIPKKLERRLMDYVRSCGIAGRSKIFDISYTTARRIVCRAGDVVGVKLRPHDLRRHAATQASRSGMPLEMVSKVILRHADLATTQRYLGEVNDMEASRWIEHLLG